MSGGLSRTSDGIPFLSLPAPSGNEGTRTPRTGRSPRLSVSDQGGLTYRLAPRLSDPNVAIPRSPNLAVSPVHIPSLDDIRMLPQEWRQATDYLLDIPTPPSVTIGTLSPIQDLPSARSDSQTPWQERCRVWTASLSLKSHLPDIRVLRRLLYGDPDNSARNADVIALFVRGLRPDPVHGTDHIRNFFAKVVVDADEYIFNEDDAGLAFPNVPALPMAAPAGTLAALYCCVHKRNVDDWERDGTLGPSDVFPLPIRLTCRVQPPLNVKPKHMRPSEQYVLMQDIVLARRQTFIHLKLMGAHLDPRSPARLLQLSELEREFHAWRRAGLQFAGIVFGDFGSRIVAGERFSGLVQVEIVPAKKREKPPTVKYFLTEKGIQALCQAISNPTERRQLLRLESLQFTGRDAMGNSHKKFPACNLKLRELFTTHIDFLEAHPDHPVPLPTFQRKTAETLLLEGLGFPVLTEGLLTWDKLAAAAIKLRDVNPEMDIQKAYVAKSQLQTKFGPALQFQCGWLDNVGVYRHGTVRAALTRCDCDPSILAFDHVPVKGTIEVTPPGGGAPLRVWVGAIKLDKRTPDPRALQHFMYGMPHNSAAGADVIALYCTDLHLDASNIEGMRNLLRQNVRNADDYIFSEEDPGTCIRHIPAILVKVAEGDPRYVALFAGVHRRHVGDFDANNVNTFEDVFHLPASLMCRSHLKNELAPNFKAHMVQEVVLFDNGQYYRLVLFGLNFDTSNEAQDEQVKSMERVIHACAMNQLPYTAIVFGDFNNRLVCPWEVGVLEQKHRTDSPNDKPTLSLSASGLASLDAQLADPGKRRDLYLTRDSWVWTGRDALGTVVTEPPWCFRKLGEMFQTMRDLVAADPNLPVPLPTYKRTPVNDILTERAGFRLDVASLVTADQLRAGFRRLKVPAPPSQQLPPQEVRDLFFSKEQTGTPVELTLQEYPMLDMGWPDGVGVYKDAPLPTHIKNFSVAEEFVGGTHAPTRSVIIVTIQGI